MNKDESLFTESLGHHFIKIKKCGSRVKLEEEEEALNVRLTYQTSFQLSKENMHKTQELEIKNEVQLKTRSPLDGIRNYLNS